MIIYNSTLYMAKFNPMDEGYIVSGQSDLVYSIESVLPVCDKLYHMDNGFQQMWGEIETLWGRALTNLLAV